MGEANRLKKLGYAAKWNLILAVVMIIAAVILFAVPLASSRLLMRLVGAAVVLLGLLNVGLQARFEKLIRASDEKIVEAGLCWGAECCLIPMPIWMTGHLRKIGRPF